MGIFKNITKTLKKAAPIIGGSIGFMIGGPAGAAIGSGIGSLAGGRSTEEALIAAALGYGVGSLGQSMGYGPGAVKAGTMGQGSGQFLRTGAASGTSTGLPTAVKSAETSGIMNKIGAFAKENPFTTAGIAGLGLTALGGLNEEEEEKDTMRPYPTGRSRLGMGLIGDKQYNLDNPNERKLYFDDVRKRQGIDTLAAGGEVNGPGTGTSDSVPARLSDGEFVLTAKSIRGAGGGDRDLGAARMYDMMSELERVA
jgi:hypothetical protein